jgi:hypothetical protein
MLDTTVILDREGRIVYRETSLDWNAVQAHKDKLIGQLRTTRYADVLAAYPDITPIDGTATFQPDGTVLDSTSLIELDSLPESLLVLGSRAVALERGQLMRQLRLLPSCCSLRFLPPRPPGQRLSGTALTPLERHPHSQNERSRSPSVIAIPGR